MPRETSINYKILLDTLFVVDHFLTNLSGCSGRGCYLTQYSGRHVGKGSDTSDLISLECKEIHCLKL